MTASDSEGTFHLDGAAIANFVKLQRSIYGWKQDTLASLAGVSLATVQRIERGIRVRPAQLRKLAVALNQPEDTFLKERVRPTPAEVAENLASMFSWTESRVPISVEPFETKRQLRELFQAHALLFDSDLGPEAEGNLAELREWLDFGGFIQAGRIGLFEPAPSRDLKVLKLWRDIFSCATRLRQTHKAVILTGVYNAEPTHGREPITIGIVAARSLLRDPAAGKIAELWADKKVDERQVFADYLDGND